MSILVKYSGKSCPRIEVRIVDFQALSCVMALITFNEPIFLKELLAVCPRAGTSRWSSHRCSYYFLRGRLILSSNYFLEEKSIDQINDF